jgi:hypothetical protein
LLRLNDASSLFEDAVVLLFLEEFSDSFFAAARAFRPATVAPVKSPVPSAFAPLFGYKQSALFEGMEQRIHSVGGEFVGAQEHPSPYRRAFLPT